ncbi:dihydropteroate synthase [Fimbriiglobus ruber]|uniref:Dihydropteroate synthase n=1 Tax=Fimbriiglobus ruber TaxID=1908690 RepID=A0A225DEK2_9BACT|nr:dihydropteroate synthase [Fimbriiglobus ruber]OWK34547.1 Dihydropteroate synthase [Fimbriiglobus ruber]
MTGLPAGRAGAYDTGMTPIVWACRGRRFEIARPLVLGIVNVTPDSFSDGGRFNDPAAAVAHALRLEAEGADLLDVGGESTRPGSASVPEAEELSRILPVVRELARQTRCPISVDTSKAAVAAAALDAGASVVNDVTGLRGDPEMPAIAARAGAGVIVMHMQGTPATMQAAPHYDDVVRDVGDFFAERLGALESAGVAREAIALDPGVGFGKTGQHNLALLANLGEFRRFGRPVCLGVSRKGFIGALNGRPPGERLAGSLAAACFAAAANSAHVVRVHDVAPTRDAMVVIDAIRRHRKTDKTET